jgi:hypothetical protein
MKNIRILVSIALILFTTGPVSAVIVFDRDTLKTTSTNEDVSFWVDGPSAVVSDTLVISPRSRLAFSLANGHNTFSASYRLNGGQRQVYNQPIQVTHPGVNYIEFQTLINGAKSATHTYVFKLDNEGPDIRGFISYNSVKLYSMFSEKQSSEIIIPRGSSFSLVSSDKMNCIKTVLYSIDEANEQDYCKPVRLSLKGTHRIRVRAIDSMDNVTVMQAIQISVVEY